MLLWFIPPSQSPPSLEWVPLRVSDILLITSLQKITMRKKQMTCTVILRAGKGVNHTLPVELLSAVQVRAPRVPTGATLLAQRNLLVSLVPSPMPTGRRIAQAPSSFHAAAVSTALAQPVAAWGFIALLL